MSKKDDTSKLESYSAIINVAVSISPCSDDGEISGLNISRPQKKSLGVKNRVFVLRDKTLEGCAKKVKEVLNEFDKLREV